MTKAITQSKKQTNTNGSKIKPAGRNGKLPSAKTLLKNYTARQILDMLTGDQMIEIFTGNQLLAMAMEIRSESEKKKGKHAA